jgi:thymidylate kinase
LWRVRLPLLRGEIVVADRYLVSALVELAARLERDDPRPLLAVRLLRALAPRPDRAYWLETPAEVALARKDGQESLDFLARQARVGMILAPALGAQRIDARQPAEQISDALITELLTEYEDRHRTALNALFCANPGPLPPDAPRAESAA